MDIEYVKNLNGKTGQIVSEAYVLGLEYTHGKTS
jgi:hypothetical protein